MVGAAKAPREKAYALQRSAPFRQLGWKDGMIADDFLVMCDIACDLFALLQGQLWRPQVAPKEDPELWSQKRLDERVSNEVKPRQLGGFHDKILASRQNG